VFAYYRWRGWLDPKQPLEHQVGHALELAGRFANRPGSFSDEELTRRAVPAWTADMMDVTAAWVRAIQKEPLPWVRARRGQGTALAGKLGATLSSPISEALLYTGTEDLFRRSEFHAGEFELQDIASQAVSVLCRPRPGETWWDACAGEGGKTLHLSDLMENQGLIWASDRVEWRLTRLKQRAARARVFNYRAVLWDGGVKPPTKTKFDGVLVDAPCTGTGTWQRNPHGRWTTTFADVRELSAVQGRLLAHAARAVKPGGRLIYAVCSLTRAETVDVARVFSAAFPEFKRLPMTPVFGRGPASPELWMWPQQTGGNGMFVAAWRRSPGGSPGA
jgi:16S rRNA (cytosine967-C5)-methyltransferase